MARGTDAARRHGELARIGLGIDDELGDRIGWNRWIDHHDLGKADNARDGRDVADKIEIELFVERRIDRVCRSDEEERVAIRGRTHDRLSADIGASSRPILDDKLLTEPLRQELAYQTRDDVVPAASGSRYECAPAASDRLAPLRFATRPAVRQRPRPDAENFGGEVSF